MRQQAADTLDWGWPDTSPAQGIRKPQGMGLVTYRSIAVGKGRRMTGTGAKMLHGHWEGRYPREGDRTEH